MQEILSKFARWALFTVVLSLIPLVLDYLRTAESGPWPPINTVLAHGELALICTAFSGVGAGELFGLSDKAKIFKIVLGGLCVITAILSIALYLEMRQSSGPIGSAHLDEFSWWLFGGTLLASTTSVIVSEEWK